MVRNYKRKSQSIDKEVLANAIAAVRRGNSVRNAAKHFKLNFETLRTHVSRSAGEERGERRHKKINETQLEKAILAVEKGTTIAKAAEVFKLNYQTLRNKINHPMQTKCRTQVFNADQEEAFMNYLLKSIAMYYGLSTRDVRNLAAGFAEKVEINVPNNRRNEKMAGKDWFPSFMKRHPNLSLRKPQTTSSARATSFNRHNVGQFYQNLSKVMEELKIQPQHLWNMDESGVTTVHTPERVVAQCGGEQIGKITSAERGQLVTVAVVVSASGAAVPTFFVFPRVRFHHRFLNGAPHGSAATANQSGWMNVDSDLTQLFEADLSTTIESVLPLPSAPPRKPTNRGRKLLATAILTSSESIESLRVEQEAATEKREKEIAKSPVVLVNVVVSFQVCSQEPKMSY